MTPMTPATSAITSADSETKPQSATGSRKPSGTVSNATWEKSNRLLVEGRLRVVRVDGNLIVAECLGDSGMVYDVTYVGARWHCSCPARVDCSHLRALQRVVKVER